ncbi:MAG: hypothetical protein ACRC4N_15405 [Gammaproteobacteria bacterium]
MLERIPCKWIRVCVCVCVCVCEDSSIGLQLIVVSNRRVDL